MKIYISSDIEGTSGASNWDEALDTAHHKFLGPQMTREVAAAARAALESGAQEVLVRDAHAGALNIDPAGLPWGTKLLRGWAPDILHDVGHRPRHIRRRAVYRLPLRRKESGQPALAHHAQVCRFRPHQRRAGQRVRHQRVYRGLFRDSPSASSAATGRYAPKRRRSCRELRLCRW